MRRPAPIGTVTTTTPLLDQPLSGTAYAVSGSGGLPRLAFILDGQVKLVPRAETKSVEGGRLRTTVPVVPDAPIGEFRLNLLGGKQGYLSQHPQPLQQAGRHQGRVRRPERAQIDPERQAQDALRRAAARRRRSAPRRAESPTAFPLRASLLCGGHTPADREWG